MLKSLSIRYKLITLTALFVGMTGVLAAFYASWLAYQNAKDNMRGEALAAALLYQQVLLDPLRRGDDSQQINELIASTLRKKHEEGSLFKDNGIASKRLEEIVLLDDSGRVLATSDPQHIPPGSMFAQQMPEFSTAVPQLGTIRQGAPPQLFELGQGRKFLVFAPVWGNGVKYANLVLEYSLGDLFAATILQVKQLVLVIALITMMMMGLAWVAANRFAAPLFLLAGNMRQLAVRYGFKLGDEESASRDEVVQLESIFSDLEQALDTAKSESKSAAEKIRHQAEHDALTGLPNRVLLQDRLEQAIARAMRNREQLAVLFLDLDHFKHVNDLHGHHAGDELLRMVSQRLLGTVRASDTVSRLGGDEFLLMLAPINNEDEVKAVAEKIIREISSPYLLEDGTEINTTVSIGISLYPEGGKTPDSLTKSADEAMYRAKENGRNNYQVFTPDMHGEAYERASLESQLRQALRQQQFVLHYQPQLELASRNITGLEALIRWQHPGKGLVYPDDFIHVAEETGLIVEIGKWVIGEACRQIRAWMDAGETVPTVAVNISFKQFRRYDLQATIEAALQHYSLPGSCLELELTESVMLRDPQKVLEVLQNLRTLGIRVSIDHFGTGYSSLLYLRKLNIDALKMDRSFVMDIGQAQGRAMIKVISDVARILGLRSIADGVENADHLQALRAIGCDEIQGYCFSKPLAADEAMLMLRQHATQKQLLKSA